LIGKDQLTLKQMMEKMNLKHRPNFIDNYLNPAMAEGNVRLLYSDSPRHPLPAGWHFFWKFIPKRLEVIEKLPIFADEK
jgi:hypothetical protein